MTVDDFIESKKDCCCHNVTEPDEVGHCLWWFNPDCPIHKHLRDPKIKKKEFKKIYNFLDD